MVNIMQKIKDLPQKPGVYLFKDSGGLVLYVGKAINLRARVASYFRKDAGQGSPRILRMISQIADLDFTITDNEVEGLVLENNFIKQLHPKYNVRLRDDKNYLFIKIGLADEIPTITYERQPTDQTARYFGPYTSSTSMKDTLRLLRRVFPYCANKKVGNKPCFYYHIGKCPGVCIGKITLAEYRQLIDKIIRFLQGRQTEVLDELKKQMKQNSQLRQYETAAKIRDQIFALHRVLERQKLVYPKKIDQDVFSIHAEGAVACINLFIIREGKLVQKENFILENTQQTAAGEILESFLARYYLEAGNLPHEILLPAEIKDQELLGLLKIRTKALGLKHRVKIRTVFRGPKLQLIRLGTANAKQHLESASDKKLLEEARLLAALKELQRILELNVLPGRIEAYDISNIQGRHAVGSMIVFDFGRPKKEDYRKFKIKFKQTPDDFAMMREMLSRRLNRSLTATEKQWPLPDLILIDGGKGQLSAANQVLGNFNLGIPAIGLAKRLEEIFLSGRTKPIVLPDNSITLYLLQRIRDEAHRFAHAYHTLLRSKSSLSSVLDQITGLGPAKKRVLLKTFGSVARLRRASLGEIANLVGNKLAEKIKAGV